MLTRILARIISLFFVTMSIMVFITGHFYANGGKYGIGPQALAGFQGRVMAWVLLALAIFPAMAWATTPRQAVVIGVMASATMGAAIILGLYVKH